MIEKLICDKTLAVSKVYYTNKIYGINTDVERLHKLLLFDFIIKKNCCSCYVNCIDDFKEQIVKSINSIYTNCK